MHAIFIYFLIGFVLNLVVVGVNIRSYGLSYLNDSAAIVAHIVLFFLWPIEVWFLIL